jgi:hypothetical protein
MSDGDSRYECVRATLTSPNAAAALFGFAFVACLGFADGGYWPSSWSWATLALLSALAVALVVKTPPGLESPSRAFIATLALFVAWTFASAAWSESVGRTVFDGQRSFLYLILVVGASVLVSRAAYPALIGGVWAGATVVSGYGLATRLFPERLGVFDPIALYRLAEPIGYSNGLGILAALGALLALGFASSAGHLAMRAAAASSLLVLVPTLYFTFSRGAWISLAVGSIAIVAVGERRLAVTATWICLAPAVVTAVVVAASSDSLTRYGAALDAASEQGHRLAAILVALALANGAIASAITIVGRKIAVPRVVRRVYATAVIVCLGTAIVVGVAQRGGPVELARTAKTSFGQTAASDQDLNQRLLSFSGSDRLPQYEVAFDQFRANPVLGSGSGTYDLHWARERPTTMTVRDAHSLYMETLGELGAVGFLLLICALAVPLAFGLRARTKYLVPTILGAYVAFLVHAGIDWDWELPAVTGSALLVATAATCAAADSRPPPLATRTRSALIALTLALLIAAFGALAGNLALTASTRAAAERRWSDSESEARKAMRWVRWSAEPWQLAGEAQLARGRRAEARRTLRTAVRKEPTDWELWFDLALATGGTERERAIRRARSLNPLSPVVTELAEETRKTVTR